MILKNGFLYTKIPHMQTLALMIGTAAVGIAIVVLYQQYKKHDRN